MSRKFARESTMKLIYQMELLDNFSDFLLEKYILENGLKEEEKTYVMEMYQMVEEHKESIDESISKYSEGWKIERLSKIDLSVLRLAIAEILYRDDIPVKVSINEALEISKKFSAEDSSKFVNGVLGAFVRGQDQNDI